MINQRILFSILFIISSISVINGQSYTWVYAEPCSYPYNCLFNSTTQGSIGSGSQTFFAVDMTQYTNYPNSYLEVSVANMTVGNLAISIQTSTDIASPTYSYTSESNVVFTPTCYGYGDGSNYCTDYSIYNGEGIICANQSPFWYILVTNLDYSYGSNVTVDLQITLYDSN